MVSFKLLLTGLFISATLIACGGDDVDKGGDPDPETEEQRLQRLYDEAVEDALDAEASEVVNTLTAITKTNADLVRDDQKGVLMVTWTSYTGYSDKVGQETELGAEVWVTPGRDFQAFCVGKVDATVASLMPLKQILGLPPKPATEKNLMVELWVQDDSMFRPSPDPEITDSVAQLDFPADVSPEHKAWIEDLEGTSYKAGAGYPWTRLGYTYNWDPDADSEVGLSEFVVKKGSKVIVNAVKSNEAYCQAP
jgi:hypothetical protein